MRIIKAEIIREAVSALSQKANFQLRSDCLTLLRQAYAKETKRGAKEILGAIIKNARIASREKIAICQDTGLPVVFLEIGQDVQIKGDLNSAVNKGIEEGYKKGYLRNSIIKDPILRGKSGYIPAVIHTQIIRGSRIKITVLPKGFGCENKSQLKMFNPTVALSEVKKFILQAVKDAGPDACPPYIVGVGIGGTADYAALLAKKALLSKVKSQNSKLKSSSQKAKVKILEAELLNKINKLNIGPMGLGGKTTALAINILTYPTHIAGFPVAVNISCHALRSASKTI